MGNSSPDKAVLYRLRMEPQLGLQPSPAASRERDEKGTLGVQPQPQAMAGIHLDCSFPRGARKHQPGQAT